MRLVALALAVLYLSDATPVNAQSSSMNAVLQSSTGYSNNVNLAPVLRDALPGDELAVKDGFTVISPSLIYIRDNRLSVYQLTYRLDAQLYFENNDANSYTNQFGVASEFLLSRRARLRFNANASQGQSQNFTLVAPNPAVQATQPGGISFLFFDVNQTYDLELSRRWRFNETVNLRSFIPTEGGTTDNVDINSIVSWQRIWERTAVGVGLRNNYFLTVAEEGQHQYLVGPEVFYRRDLWDSWNAEVGIGVVAVTSPNNIDQTGVTIEPTGRAALRFRRDQSEINIEAVHDAQPNIQIGEFFINDSANVGVNYNVVREPRVTVGVLGGAQRAREISIIDNNIGSASFIYNADAFLAWQLSPGLEVGARYQYMRQDADPNSNLRTFRAHTGLFTITGSYPGGPRRQASLRRSYRVDGSGGDDPFGGSDRRQNIQDKKPPTRR